MLLRRLMRDYRRVTLLISVGFVFSSASVLLWSELLNSTEREFKTNEIEYEMMSENNEILRTGNISLPLCTNNLLNRRAYNFTQWVIEPGNLLISSSMSPCRFLDYNMERVVSCFDTISRNYGARNKTKPMRLFFIGDSRIRHKFFNIIKLIPNYDRTWDPFPFYYHEEMNVENKMLNLQVSFKWYPLINDKVLAMLRRWTTTNRDQAPYLLLLSMGIHHMLQKHGADFGPYQKRLTDLGPVLHKLSEFTKIIWLNHYPTVDLANVNLRTVEVYEEILQRYNEAVKRIFKNYQGVRIWDSSNTLTEEYVRGCSLYERNIPGDYIATYTSCKDFVHTGNVALFGATQLFLNDMCNSHFYFQNGATETSILK